MLKPASVIPIPIILNEGRVLGNWRKAVKSSWFERLPVASTLIYVSLEFMSYWESFWNSNQIKFTKFIDLIFN